MTSTVAGVKTMTVTVDGEPVKVRPGDGNAHAVFVAGQPDPGHPGVKFTVSGGEKTADGVDAHTVTVSLVDKDGNPVLTADTSKLVGGVDPAGGVTVGAWTNQGDGTYTATVVSTVAGVKAVSVSFDGRVVRGEGNTNAVFVAGAVDPVGEVVEEEQDLAITGLTTVPLVLLALVIVATGGLLLLTTRRRRQEH